MVKDSGQGGGSASHQGVASVAADLAVEGAMPRLVGATTWLNSPPLTPDGLRGSVVLVQFWTYTCVNWLRTLPYVRAWSGKYRDHGLVVIGVHTPEFGFEQELDNVQRAMRAMGIDYPVAIDNDYAVWGAFANHYWPALYFVDAAGKIRHHRFGEGDYERSEMVVQVLLAEAGYESVPRGLVSVHPSGPEVAADWAHLRTPETYLGDDGGARNDWELSGDWTVSMGKVSLNEPNGRIVCQFHARDVNLVMGPAEPGTSVRFRVLVDGRPATDARGADVDEEAAGIVSDQRMYQLIRQRTPIADRRFEIEFLDPGVEAFVFTFG